VRFTMFFWQDEKDALSEELDYIKRRIDGLEHAINTIQKVIAEGYGFKFQNHPLNYGLKKDGTPKAKPGRKPR